MKKQLLLLVAGFGVSVCAVAQNNSRAKLHVAKAPRLIPAATTVKNDPKAVDFATQAATQRNPNTTVVAPSTLTRVPCGNSANILSVQIPESRNLQYNQDINTITFSHRKCTELYSTGNSGYIQTTFSTNGGTSFDSTTVLNYGDANNLGRYPSHMLYNPLGNTNPAMAFSVASGPYLTNTTVWTGGYFGSTRLDGTLNDQQRLDSSLAGQMPRVGNSATATGVAVLGCNYNVNTYSATVPLFVKNWVVNQGTFVSATNNFLWTQHTISHSLSIDPSDNSQNLYDIGTMAFGPDGLTGYFVFLGRDSINDPRAPMPIIYKSVDGGTTWNLVTAPNFSGITNLINRLPAMTNGTPRPWFSGNNGFTATVDANNHLHIGCLVYPAASDDDDSLNFIYNNVRQLFDVYETSSGWDALFLDSLHTDAMPAANSPYTTNGGIGWDARLQFGRTADGTKVFYGWMDTDPMNSSTGFNEYPDLMVKAMNVNTGAVTPTMNMTMGGAYDGNNYWMYMAQTIMSDGAGTYTVPMTVSQTRVAGNDGSGATQHWYVGGVQVTDNQFVGVQEVNSQLAISQNYPNPASGNTSIDIDLRQASNVSVSVYNALGQLVNEKSEQQLPAGKHTLSFDVSHLTTGIYFYTVKAGDNSVTRKMIVN